MESEDDCGNTYLLTLYQPEETEWKVFNGLLYMETLYRALDNLELLRALGQTFHTSQASFLVYLPVGKIRMKDHLPRATVPVSCFRYRKNICKNLRGWKVFLRNR